jgi:hypothetical protein
LDIEECNSFGNGIEKVKIFLRKALSYEIPSTLWHELTNINKLRNCLVHNGPVIFPEFELPDENDQSCSKYMFDKLELKVDIKRDLMDYLMQNKLIQNWGIQLQIIPTKEYCNRVLIFAEELLEKTHHDLNKFVKSKG